MENPVFEGAQTVSNLQVTSFPDPEAAGDAVVKALRGRYAHPLAELHLAFVPQPDGAVAVRGQIIHATVPAVRPLREVLGEDA